jgi:hypothetical protein
MVGVPNKERDVMTDAQQHFAKAELLLDEGNIEESRKEIVQTLLALGLNFESFDWEQS